MKKISDNILPLFKGEFAKQLLNTIEHSHLKAYTDEEKENTEMIIKEFLEKELLSKHIKTWQEQIAYQYPIKCRSVYYTIMHYQQNFKARSNFGSASARPSRANLFAKWIYLLLIIWVYLIIDWHKMTSVEDPKVIFLFI